MYAWYVYLDSTGNPADGGIWQSLNAGASWASISNTTITSCGDVAGCGVQQGFYNLELLAVPDGTATDLYAGAINLYKCDITTQNPTCAASPFINLTHVYGCDPIGAPAHVHPDQHALAYAIPTSGADSGNALLYFANDGGIYRALNGFTGLNTGLCSGTNQFDDLNQSLGSMTQFVSFSQHPTDPNTLLGGTQDNGSPATAAATTSLSWVNVLGGDGGYNAIDPHSPLDWYASNPDLPPGGLGVQFCTSGANCTNSSFSLVVTSSTVGGDDGAFYFPYILDRGSSTAMLVGTCRVWRGARTGGAFTALSPNFDTLGSGTCTGSEVNQVRALAAGGLPDSNGSTVIYAATSGLGPLDGPLNTPAGGRVWVTTNASAGVSAFADVTNNGPLLRIE
jgi:large repetitive protein